MSFYSKQSLLNNKINYLVYRKNRLLKKILEIETISYLDNYYDSDYVATSSDELTNTNYEDDSIYDYNEEDTRYVNSTPSSFEDYEYQAEIFNINWELDNTEKDNCITSTPIVLNVPTIVLPLIDTLTKIKKDTTLLHIHQRIITSK